MMKKKIEELRALAMVATQGPWERSDRPSGPFWHISSGHTIGGRTCISGRQSVGSVHAANKKNDPEYAAMFQANADFIATANPATIIELLDKFEQLTDELALTRAEVNSMLADADTHGEKIDELAKVAAAIHYPACWDVSAYSTLSEAMSAVYGNFKCGECGTSSKPDTCVELRRAVRSMSAMLGAHEWAEHVSTDSDAQALELVITELVGAYTARSNVGPQSSDLHTAIMNIPCNKELSDFSGEPDDLVLYRKGHRDARHAAAELVAAARTEAPVPAESKDDSLAIELKGVQEQKDSGFWHACSGCYDTEDGHPTGNYAYSAVFGCALGSGCHECGGLGVTWDNNDYSEVDAAPGLSYQHAPSDNTEGGAQ
jgi:hypothetical protein